MTSYIPIAPIDILKQMTSFSVDGLLMNLFVGVHVSVSIFDSEKTKIDTRTVYLTGEDYMNWNNDDQYIINKVAEKLGFTILIPTPNPEPQVFDPKSQVPNPVV
jgi:hypothetical protein